MDKFTFTSDKITKTYYFNGQIQNKYTEDDVDEVIYKCTHDHDHVYHVEDSYICIYKMNDGKFIFVNGCSNIIHSLTISDSLNNLLKLGITTLERGVMKDYKNKLFMSLPNIPYYLVHMGTV